MCTNTATTITKIQDRHVDRRCCCTKYYTCTTAYKENKHERKHSQHKLWFLWNSKEFKYSLSPDSLSVSKLRFFNFFYKTTYLEVKAKCNSLLRSFPFSFFFLFFLLKRSTHKCTLKNNIRHQTVWKLRLIQKNPTKVINIRRRGALVVCFGTSVLSIRLVVIVGCCVTVVHIIGLCCRSFLCSSSSSSFSGSETRFWPASQSDSALWRPRIGGLL